jgi:hypothetical protein
MTESKARRERALGSAPLLRDEAWWSGPRSRHVPVPVHAGIMHAARAHTYGPARLPDRRRPGLLFLTATEPRRAALAREWQAAGTVSWLARDVGRGRRGTRGRPVCFSPPVVCARLAGRATPTAAPSACRRHRPALIPASGRPPRPPCGLAGHATSPAGVPPLQIPSSEFKMCGSNNG